MPHPGRRATSRAVILAVAAGLGGLPTLLSTGPGAHAEATAVQPQRLVDTRGSARVAPGTVLHVDVPDTTAGAGSVAVNITATDALAAGYVTAWPCGQAAPGTSVLNFRTGHPDANLALVGTGDEICLATSAPAHLLVDLMGWFTGGGDVRGSTPARLADTRSGAPLTPFEPRAVAVTGGGVPADAAGVVLNVTIARPTADGYALAYPCGGDVPGTSTVNFRAGEDVAALTVVAPADGEICVRSSVTADVLVDRFGWLPSGSSVQMQQPGRLLDTRQGDWPYGPAQSGWTTTLQVAGNAGVPNDAASALLTVTAVDATSSGYVTVWPCDEPAPDTSIVNTWPGSLRANLAFARLSATGTVCLRAQTTDGSPMHLLVDAVGAVGGGSAQPDPPTAPIPPTPPPTTPTPPDPAGPLPSNPVAHFSTLPPGSALPSGATCASQVRPTPENRPGNAAANATTWSSQPTSFTLGTRADGQFTGTTDEILQWVACKWGIDEDIVRAQVAKESGWHQDALGDYTDDPDACGPFVPQTSPCAESVGLMQVRWLYHQPAFEGAVKSSAYNVDYSYAGWRSCYEGNETWLGGSYGPGDVWGCVGLWFSGRWHTAPAEEYIGAVQGYLSDRVWEQPDFAYW